MAGAMVVAASGTVDGRLESMVTNIGSEGKVEDGCKAVLAQQQAVKIFLASVESSTTGTQSSTSYD